MKILVGAWLIVFLLTGTLLRGDVGDPQIRTDHAWYPGELACSTFERLFATQAIQYQKACGRTPVTDEDKALASWFWRNTHYCHAEEGAENLWGVGFGKGGDARSREYWTGLFAHGFGLCGTTHSQWSAEMEYLLGHGRARAVGVDGHNSFEVFLTGGAYDEGRWALLDHDLSTVVFASGGKRLLSIREVQADWQRLIGRDYFPEKQRGWLVCGLHPGDGNAYRQYNAAEYLPGYAGLPPMVHLRRGETLRRYFQPGLADGRTFVFWGRNYQTGGIAGPERSLTWVNQPEKMYGSREGPTPRAGQARFANAVYTYRPDLGTDDYREGVIDERDDRVTFEFYTPYVIAATPPDDKPWSIYETGCRNGLVLHGTAQCQVAISVDQGGSWNDCGAFRDGLDLTDHVKGQRQYFLRFHASPKTLARSGLTMTTVCQANPAVLPQLKDDGTQVDFLASNHAALSAGPTRPQAQAHLVAGEFGTPRVTLELASPRQEAVTAVYAAAHIASGNPPSPEVKYTIDYSVDAGKSWQPMVQDWSIARRGEEPDDFWSQSLCYGFVEITTPSVTSIQVRFSNSAGKKYLRAEAHLVYRTRPLDATEVTFHWDDETGSHRASHVFDGGTPNAAHWKLDTGKNVQTRWVEFAVR